MKAKGPSWARPSIQKELQREITGDVLVNVPMKDFTSFRVGGPADLMAFPRSKEELRRLICKARAMDIPFIVIGKGTNIIVKDRGIRGLVIRLSGAFEEIEPVASRCRDVETVLLRVGAGTWMKKLLSYCLQMGYGGLEFSVGIPGTFGGAVVNNAGTLQGEMKDVIRSISIMDALGNVSKVDRGGLKFSYRNLLLPPEAIVIDGVVGLKRMERERIREKLKEQMLRRRNSQPVGAATAGCIFKNPEEAPAGMIIDDCGLKGMRVGGAQVSEKHANFIVNLGNASAFEVLELIDLIRTKVLEKKGIDLALEVRVLGD